MSTETVNDQSEPAAFRLLAHLRDNPDDVTLPPGRLAQMFGLDASFVESVLSQVHESKLPEQNRWAMPKLSMSWLPTGWNLGWRAFDRLIVRPTRFITITFALFIAISLLAAWVNVDEMGFHVDVKNAKDLQIDSFGVSFLLAVTMCLHMLCYLRTRMTRYALYGGLVVWVMSSFVLMTVTWLDLKPGAEAQRAGIVLIVGLVMFLVACLYAGAGALMSVLGGWFQLRMQDRKQEQMTRQDLLERYFALQERLENSQNLAHGDRWEDWPIIRSLRQNPYISAMVLSFLLHAINVYVIHAFRINPFGPNRQPIPVAFIVVSLAINTVSIGVFVILTFLAGNPWRAMVTSLSYSIGQLGADLLPFSVISAELLSNPSYRVTTAASTLLFALIAMFIGGGALVQQRAAHETNLQLNDQATIMSEMLKIQWRLSDHSGLVCVLVVDAAKSSEMKTAADPLAVEYSFREYQEWIEEICSQLDGRVHSTAGDGAVVAFASPQKAFSAAKRIQTGIVEFNQTRNRLKSPFRLRIGLHVGKVSGEIDKVQFTDVIDIAAHIQDVAPVSGIAVSGEVVSQLGTEEFIPLARMVDGHHVSLALNPTED